MKHLGQLEKRTFRLHQAYSILEGFIAGVLALNEIVFIKTLKGSHFQLSFLVQFSMLVFLFLIFINEFLSRVKNKKKLLRITSIITRLPLIAILFFPASPTDPGVSSLFHLFFLAIFFIYYLADPVINPIINLFLKSSYRHAEFGKLYGKATMINKIVMLITTFSYGILLDYNPLAYRFVFPLVAISGITSIYLLSQIPYRSDFSEPRRELKIFESIRKSAHEMYLTLKNKPYRDFEIGFMFYGFSYMASASIIPIFFTDGLNLNYSSIAFYKNSYNIIAILSLPFFGRLIGKIDPRSFAVITFGAICLYLSTLSIAMYFPQGFQIGNIQVLYILLIYIIFHSVFAATMSLLWNIGSAYFCKKDEAATYQAAHLSLTGFRSIFSPLAGIFLYEWYGFTTAFLVVAASLFLGVLFLLWSKKANPLTNSSI